MTIDIRLSRAKSWADDLASGMSLREIASRDGVSYETVRLEVKNAGLTDRVHESRKIQRELRATMEAVMRRDARRTEVRAPFGVDDFDWDEDDVVEGRSDRIVTVDMLESIAKFLRESTGPYGYRAYDDWRAGRDEHASSSAIVKRFGRWSTAKSEALKLFGV